MPLSRINSMSRTWDDDPGPPLSLSQTTAIHRASTKTEPLFMDQLIEDPDDSDSEDGRMRSRYAVASSSTKNGLGTATVKGDVDDEVDEIQDSYEVFCSQWSTSPQDRTARPPARSCRNDQNVPPARSALPVAPTGPGAGPLDAAAKRRAAILAALQGDAPPSLVLPSNIQPPSSDSFVDGFDSASSFNKLQKTSSIGTSSRSTLSGGVNSYITSRTLGPSEASGSGSGPGPASTSRISVAGYKPRNVTANGGQYVDGLGSVNGHEYRKGSGFQSASSLASVSERKVDAGPSVEPIWEKSKRPAPWAADSLKTNKRSMSVTSVVSVSSTSSASGANLIRGPNIQQKIVLSGEQQKVLGMVVQQGQSLFFTGSAGTGKSVLLREIIRSLRKKYAAFSDAVAVTASTGIAACNIGGVTLHSFAGCGLGTEETNHMVSKIRKNKKANSRWMRTKVLIIDEISMIDGNFFDKLSEVGSILRKKRDVPFGGIQVVVTGDFFQLPPVTKGNQMTNFAFEAKCWDSIISVSVNLTKVFRQKDQVFVDMLNEMRFGRLTTESIKRFQSLSRLPDYRDGIEPTELFPLRQQVDYANNARIDAIRSESWTFVAVDGPGQPNPVRDKLLDAMMAPPTIVLKIDSQVMLIKNIDESLVNGSMGKVLGFVHKHLYQEDSQGKWIGKEVDPAELMADGDDSEESAMLKMKLARKRMKEEASMPLPVVRFRIPGGGTRDMLVDVDVFKAEQPNGEVLASRTQLPLILAWAMSIHKSQGQSKSVGEYTAFKHTLTQTYGNLVLVTIENSNSIIHRHSALERVKVDLGKVFEKGQAYVALSRATSLEGLQILNFRADKVMAHPKVKDWSRKLKSFDET